MAFSVGEEELAGLDAKPLVGHLAAWNYFMSIDNPLNKQWIKRWHTFIKKSEAYIQRSYGGRRSSASACGLKRLKRPARQIQRL